jgi:hypothetical protein
MSFFSAVVDASIIGLGGLLGFTMGGATGRVLRVQRVRSGSGENEKTADWETRMDGHSK